MVSVQLCHLFQFIELLLVCLPSAGKSRAGQGTEYENGTCCTFVPEDKPQTDEEDNPVTHPDFSLSLKEWRNLLGEGSVVFEASLSTETTPTPGELSL